MTFDFSVQVLAAPALVLDGCLLRGDSLAIGRELGFAAADFLVDLGGLGVEIQHVGFRGFDGS